MAIDIIMPFYGDVSLLEIAVLSVQAQEGDWRLVVVDDHYPGTGQEQFIRSLADERIEYVLNDQNLGISRNFQRCVGLAKAEHTVIMGCDDILMPNYVTHLTSLAARYPTAAYIQPGVATIDRAGKPNRQIVDLIKSLARPRVRGTALLSGESLAASLLSGNWTYFPSVCWRTEVLKQHSFDPQFDIVLDLALQLDITAAGGELLVDDEVVFLYRRHSASASSWNTEEDRRFAEEKALFHQSVALMEARGWLAASRAAKIHITSRLHAASKLPEAAFRRELPAIRALLAHLLH